MECCNCFTADMILPDGQNPDIPVYYICPNCAAVELAYVPQDYQAPLHEVPYREIYDEERNKMVIASQIIGVFGGYGSGKSRSTLAEIVVRAMENPGGTGLLTAPTLQQLKRTTLKTLFKEVLPPELILNYNKTDGEIHLINGFTFYTIPSDDEEKLRSINAGIIHMEEASGIKRSIYDQLLTRQRDPFVKNRCFIVCSNPDLGWIKDIFVDNVARANPNHPEHEDYNEFISTFVWPTGLNKMLPPDFIAINSKGKPDWWIKRYLGGSFEHSEGMVYPNFSRTLHQSQDYVERMNTPKHTMVDEHGIPLDWERFTNLDHGLRNPTAFYESAINPNTGEVVTYAEYYMPNKLVPDHAPVIKDMISDIPAGKIWFQVADPSIRNKTDPVNGKSVQGLYQEYGLFFSPGNNDVAAGILKVNSYIERGKWVIFADKCPNLAKEGLRYKFPEITMDNADENLDEKPVKANDHAMDSMKYGFMRLPDDPLLLKTVAYEPKKEYSTTRMVENEYNWDRKSNTDDDDDFNYGEGDWMSYT